MTVVVDTNVILVANRQHEGVSDVCVVACAKRLLDLTRNGRIAIDDSYRILREYQQKTQPHVGKRPRGRIRKMGASQQREQGALRSSVLVRALGARVRDLPR